MASYLNQCTGVCGRVVRTVRPPTEASLCDSCRPGVKAEEARVQRETEVGEAREAAKVAREAEAHATARAADKKARAEAAAKAAAPVRSVPERRGRFSR